tara:strand:- start:4898 stop:5590 length:693 start_codon:yes stop_codon:yes gene_type:complete
MSSKLKIFKTGSLEMAPHLLSVIPFGILFGAICMELGFNPLLTYATSLIIFGGASQIVFVQLLSGGASSLVAITSVGIINSRHLLYGAVLAEYLQKLSLFKKLIISYFITDQGFAVSNIYLKKNKHREFNYYHLIGAGTTLWISWQISTIMGIILGSFVPNELGLKFAIPLTFIAIIVQELRKIDHVIVMIFSGISSVILFNMPLGSYIILSPIIGLIIAYTIIKFKLTK